LFENTIRGKVASSRIRDKANAGTGGQEGEGTIQKSVYEEELMAQKKQHKVELRKFIRDVNYHDQESYPFTREDLQVTNLLVDQDTKLKLKLKLADKPRELNETERNLPSSKRPQPKVESPFHKERKKWHLGNPDPLGLHHKPIYSIGEIQINQLESNKQVQKTIRQQQMQLKQNFEQIHEENQQRIREEAEFEKKRRSSAKDSVLPQSQDQMGDNKLIKLKKIQKSTEEFVRGVAQTRQRSSQRAPADGKHTDPR